MDTAGLKATVRGPHLLLGWRSTRSRVLPVGLAGRCAGRGASAVSVTWRAGGGYVLAAVHNIQEDVPPENILAMADAACEVS